MTTCRTLEHMGQWRVVSMDTGVGQEDGSSSSSSNQGTEQSGKKSEVMLVQMRKKGELCCQEGAVLVTLPW